MLKNQPPKHWELHFSWWELINGARAAMRWKGALPVRTAAVGWHEEKQCVCRRKQDWDNFAWWEEKYDIREKGAFPELFIQVTSPFLFCRLSSYSCWVSLGSPCIAFCITRGDSILFSAGWGKRSRAWNTKCIFFSIKTHPKAKQILFIHKRAFSV